MPLLRSFKSPTKKQNITLSPEQQEASMVIVKYSLAGVVSPALFMIVALSALNPFFLSGACTLLTLLCGFCMSVLLLFMTAIRFMATALWLYSLPIAYAAEKWKINLSPEGSTLDFWHSLALGLTEISSWTLMTAPMLLSSFDIPLQAKAGLINTLDTVTSIDFVPLFEDEMTLQTELKLSGKQPHLLSNLLYATTPLEGVAWNLETYNLQKTTVTPFTEAHVPQMVATEAPAAAAQNQWWLSALLGSFFGGSFSCVVSLALTGTVFWPISITALCSSGVVAGSLTYFLEVPVSSASACGALVGGGCGLASLCMVNNEGAPTPPAHTVTDFQSNTNTFSPAVVDNFNHSAHALQPKAPSTDVVRSADVKVAEQDHKVAAAYAATAAVASGALTVGGGEQKTSTEAMPSVSSPTPAPAAESAPSGSEQKTATEHQQPPTLSPTPAPAAESAPSGSEQKTATEHQQPPTSSAAPSASSPRGARTEKFPEVPAAVRFVGDGAGGPATVVHAASQTNPPLAINPGVSAGGLAPAVKSAIVSAHQERKGQVNLFERLGPERLNVLLQSVPLVDQMFKDYELLDLCVSNLQHVVANPLLNFTPDDFTLMMMHALDEYPTTTFYATEQQLAELTRGVSLLATQSSLNARRAEILGTRALLEGILEKIMERHTQLAREIEKEMGLVKQILKKMDVLEKLYAKQQQPKYLELLNLEKANFQLHLRQLMNLISRRLALHAELEIEVAKFTLLAEEEGILIERLGEHSGR